jgi:aquaporin Z
MKTELQHSFPPTEGAPERRLVSSRAGAALAAHWPEYLMEAAGLGLFMMSACIFGVLLEHPASALHHAIEDPLLRRALGGVAMGLTAVAIICSAWGKRSGAHLNPSITLAYFLLGKIEPWDAAFYAVAQFLGGAAGVGMAELVIGFPLRHSAVNYAVTLPGEHGPMVAFWAEMLISLTLMITVLVVSNHRRLSRWTPFFAGALVATFITWESPFSGMSMNPARTFGSAVAAQEWTALWLYFTAPPLGMLLAALLYSLRIGAHRVFCAKLHHNNDQRCIFRCNYGELDVQ